MLKNRQGKYLLERRNPKKYPEVGPKWDIVGGPIALGTSFLENLKKEIKEEVGLGYRGEPKLVAAQDILKTPARQVVRLTLVGEIGEEPRIDDDCLEVKWFSAKEVKNMSVEILVSYLKELIDKEVVKLE